MPEPNEDSRPIKSWILENRNVITFWFLGLANNYGYVVMLSAAHDILANFGSDETQVVTSYQRECNALSTGIILLADIMPSIIIKIASPFIPLYIHMRMAIAILLSLSGFIMVAVNTQKWLVILGVVCTSLSCGLGESSLLSYVVFFKTKNVISTWSSGTGGAGVIGAVSYATLTSFGLSPVVTLLIMLVIPISEAFCFYLCIDHPETVSRSDHDLDKSAVIEADVYTIQEKIKIIPYLLVTYMAPFGLVYLFEYSINQGLFELLYFPSSFLSHAEQYRWYSVLYQVGVFISRSSMNIVQINNIWFIAFLQFLNVLVCLFEAFYGFMNFLPIIMALIFWEGLVGGASYVNTYRRIVSEMPPESRQFCMAMNSFADVLMITCAGLVAYPLHNVICNYPSPYQLPYQNLTLSH